MTGSFLAPDLDRPTDDGLRADNSGFVWYFGAGNDVQPGIGLVTRQVYMVARRQRLVPHHSCRCGPWVSRAQTLVRFDSAGSGYPQAHSCVAER